MMSGLNRTNREYLKSIFSSILLFLLVWEWLRPLFDIPEHTELYMIEPFLIAVAGFLLADLLRIPEWLAWPLKLFICFCVIGHFFYGDLPFRPEWWFGYFELLMNDFAALLHGDILSFSPENRTLLFLLGWALMLYAVHYFIIHRNDGLWFVAATLFYLLFMQFVLGADTSYGVLRTAVWGLLLLALLQYPRLEKEFQIRLNFRGWPKLWIASGALVTAVSILIGYASAAEISTRIQPFDWQRQFHFASFTNAVYSPDSRPSGTVARTGYGHDDSRLGGSLQEDQGIAFTAKTERLTYWRGESKSVYDGNGWLSEENDWRGYRIGEKISPSLHPEEAAADAQWAGAGSAVQVTGFAETFEQEVLLPEGRFDRILFAGGEIVSVNSAVTGDGKLLESANVLADAEIGTYRWNSGGERVAFYKMTISQPELDEDALRLSGEQYPDEVLERYLQLPDGLPDRVKALAAQIVADKKTTYDQVKAVEAYLQQNYTYDTKNIGYPKKGQDFVDHFLFDQKYGYCDHFSTSMVIMLRSVGIPARWVKGYAPGEVLDGGSEGGPMTVIVRNKHAHSWVEVFFPGAGWIPFEPTAGFSMGQSVESATFVQDGEGAGQEQSKLGGANGFSGRLSGLIEYTKPLVASSRSTVHKASQALDSYRQWIFQAVGAVLLVILLSVLTLRRLNRKEGLEVGGQSAVRNTFLRSMDKIWSKLFRKFGRIRPQQTVREYVRSVKVENERQRQALIEFAEIYENQRYGNEISTRFPRKYLSELWEKMRNES
jgi:transglutaminase-like putative cysteine protease